MLLLLLFFFFFFFFSISGVVSGEVCYPKLDLQHAEDGKTSWKPADPSCTTKIQLPGMNVNNPITPDTQDAQEIESNVDATSEKLGKEM